MSYSRVMYGSSFFRGVGGGWILVSPQPVSYSFTAQPFLREEDVLPHVRENTLFFLLSILFALCQRFSYPQKRVNLCISGWQEQLPVCVLLFAWSLVQAAW